MMSKQSQRYSQVPSEDSDLGDETSIPTSGWRAKFRYRGWICLVLPVVLFLTSLVNLFVAAKYRVNDRTCAQHMNAVCKNMLHCLNGCE